jgi:hypothetical protein
MYSVCTWNLCGGREIKKEKRVIVAIVQYNSSAMPDVATIITLFLL